MKRTPTYTAGKMPYIERVIMWNGVTGYDIVQILLQVTKNCHDSHATFVKKSSRASDILTQTVFHEKAKVSRKIAVLLFIFNPGCHTASL